MYGMRMMMPGLISPLTAMTLALLIVWDAGTAKAVTDEIGKVTRLQGTATQRQGDDPRSLQAGSVIRAGAVVETGAESRLQIIFIDGSQMTLGEEARLVMDELVYSVEASNTGAISQSFEIFAGTFRFVTGAVGREKQDAVQISTPVATIGIRGTDFFCGPLAAGMPPGQIHYGFMSISGAIDVTTLQGTVTLDEENEGTFLPMSGNAAPTPANIWDQEAIEEAYASIAFR